MFPLVERGVPNLIAIFREYAHASRCHFDAIKPTANGDLSRPVLETSNSAETIELVT